MLGILLVSIIFILGCILIWYCIPKWFPRTDNTENFLNIPDSQLYQPVDRTLKPSDIQYQIPIAQNQLTDLQLQSLDTDVLRNVRVLVNFSLTDELDFYQMYNLLKQFKGKKYDFKYDSSNSNNYQGDRQYRVMESEKIMEDIKLYKKLDKSLNKNFSKQPSVNKSSSKYIESNFYLT